MHVLTESNNRFVKSKMINSAYFSGIVYSLLRRDRKSLILVPDVIKLCSQYAYKKHTKSKKLASYRLYTKSSDVRCYGEVTYPSSEPIKALIS